jgi:hypothetical protein
MMPLRLAEHSLDTIFLLMFQPEWIIPAITDAHTSLLKRRCGLRGDYVVAVAGRMLNQDTR